MPDFTEGRRIYLTKIEKAVLRDLLNRAFACVRRSENEWPDGLRGISTREHCAKTNALRRSLQAEIKDLLGIDYLSM